MIIFLFILLVLAPFLAAIFITVVSHDDDGIAMSTGVISVIITLVMSAFVFLHTVGTLSSMKTDTAYNVKKVMGVNDGSMVIYANELDDDDLYYYYVECSKLLEGCPDAKSWPKKFKLIKDGDKKIIVELKNTTPKK